MFVQEAELLPYVREEIMASEYADKYNFMQSSPNYYELLPKDASKGNGLLKIAEILGKSQNTVKTLLSRGREKLKVLYGGDGK